MLTPSVRLRAGKPLRRSIRNVPTKSHAVQVNECRLRDPSVRDDSDGVQPTRVDLFDVRGSQTERAKTETHDRSYTSDERSSDGSRQKQQIFADNKKPDT